MEGNITTHVVIIINVALVSSNLTKATQIFLLHFVC
jgi:hypothetical protein